MGSIKMFIVLVLVYVLGITSARNTRRFDLEDALTHFEEFIVKYNKSYTESEKQIRYKIFVENLKRINIMNEKSEFAEYGINKFADLTSEEFVSMYTGYRPSDTPYKCTKISSSIYNQLVIPDEFDWRSRSVVSRVKQQGTCGSCWAFSVIGNVESINAIKTGKMVELSEQQLVDCEQYYNPGCNASDRFDAFSNLMTNGVMSAASYPYIAKNGTCKYDAQKVAVRLSDCISMEVEHGEEDAVAKFLHEVGPLSILINGTHLQAMEGGIHDHCPPSDDVNHAVLLVGYGKDPYPHWIVKNSWGDNWGDGGYFKLKKGVNCLLLLDAPILSAVIN